MSRNGKKESAELDTSSLPSLPRGWCWTTVGQVGHVQLGRQRSPKNRSDKYPTKYIRAANITWQGLSLDDVLDMDFKPSERKTYTLQPGDILLSEASGSADEVGKPVIWAGEISGCCFQNTVIRFRARGIPADFPFVAFCHFARNGLFARAAKGIGIHHLGAERFAQMPFPLPPLGEQQRIKAKVDELFSDLDAGMAALKRVQANLKRYRAAVLKAAVEGRLTAEWREKNGPTETGPQLLARILAERRRKWEEDQLAAFTKARKSPPPKWKDKYKEPAGVDDTNLPALPDGWCWARMDQVGDVRLGRQRSPKHHTGPHMRPYLRVANVFEDRIDISDVMEMNFTPDEYETYRLQYGDVLLNEGQSMELVGRPAIYRDEVSGACFTNTLVRFRADYGIDPEYALAVFLTYLRNGRFQKIATITVNIAHLGAGRLSELELPVPPLDEQREIVSEVKRLESLIKAVEDYANAAVKRAGRLRQAILKRAFEGKLVPQDSTDEPASDLLARIRNQREEANGNCAKPAKPRQSRTTRTTMSRITE